MGIGLFSVLVGKIQRKFPRSLTKKDAIESNLDHMKFTSHKIESKKCSTRAIVFFANIISRCMLEGEEGTTFQFYEIIE